jgi:hypothetical protein
MFALDAEEALLVVGPTLGYLLLSLEHQTVAPVNKYWLYYYKQGNLIEENLSFFYIFVQLGFSVSN